MKLSVIVCLSEAPRHLQAQLESIVAQTRPPDEVLLCGAGPSETLETARAALANAPFQVRSDSASAGADLRGAVGRAIELCEGDIIVLSERDGAWLPEKLHHIERAFSDSPDAGLVAADAELVDDDSRPIGCSLWESMGFGQGEQKAFREKKRLPALARQDDIASANLAFRSAYKHLILPFPNDISVTAWIALVVGAVAQISLVGARLSRYRLSEGRQFGEGQAAPPDKAKEATAATEATARKRDELSEQIFLLGLVSERLSAFDDSSRGAGQGSELAGRMAHLLARANLPAGRSRRIRYVFKELVTRRYHLYSYGLHSALKDILIVPDRSG